MKDGLRALVGGIVGIASDRARVGDARVRSSEGVGGDQDRWITARVLSPSLQNSAAKCV